MSVELAPGAVTDVLAGLDPALPGLGESYDMGRVSRAFAEAWDDEVSGCRLLGCRYEPGRRCVTSHALAVGPVGARRLTIGVLEVTPRGRSVRRFDEDEALPGLRLAIDTRLAAERLASCCTGTVQRCTVEPVRYRPGERAVLRYRLTTARGPEVLFGKVLVRGAVTAARTLASLHETSRFAVAAPTVAPPVAVFDELGLVVQAALIGDPLHRLLFDRARSVAERLSALHRTGRAVAALHDGPAVGAPFATAAADALDLESYVPVVGSVDPALGDRFAEAVVRAATVSRGLAVDAAVPSHGALRTDQVMVCAGRPALVDLDGFCLSHRGRDLGNLLAYLRWKAIRQPRHGAVVAEGRSAFLAGYRAGGGAPADRPLRLFEALSLLKIAGRRFRSLNVLEWPSVPDLIDAAIALLSSGGGA